MLKFEEIISKFQIEGEITDVNPLGHGTVNHTYEIVCGGEHYVLQEMNHIVFKYPTEVMNNLFLVTEYLRDAIEREGRDPELEALTFIRTKAGNQLLQTEEGSYFRLYRMICCGEEMQKPILRTDVLDMKDLKPGMILKGTVRNVIDFGAFVDIGVHQDGLVHISQMSKKYIKHPLEAVSVGYIVEVKVLGVDMAKKRISLSMILDEE